MARKVVTIPGLPQLPAGMTNSPEDRFTTDQLRVLWAWKRSLDALIEENNTGSSGHIIQEEGVDLPNEARLNFIGATVTAADDPSNGRTNVTVTASSTPAPASSGEHLLLLGDLQAAQDDATMALGLVGSSTKPTVIFGGTLWLTMIAGGGGGCTSTSAANSGSGGGSGESVEGMLIKITPGASYGYAVGSGGATDTDGGSTTFSSFTTLGGSKGATSGAGGAGGGARGGAGGATGSGLGAVGSHESTHYYGGGGGGGRATLVGNAGGTGAGSGGYLGGGPGGASVASQSGGGGGSASVYGIGATGGAGGSVGTDAASTSYGAGGGGGGGFSTGKAGGAGAGGYILITYLGGSATFTSGSGTWVAPT